MSFITPTSVAEVEELVEGGGIITFTALTFSNPVRLIGLPQCVIVDGRGFTHRVTSASPHLTVPPFGTTVQVRSASTSPGLSWLAWRGGDNSIIDAVTGDMVAAGNYPVTSPPPVPPVPPVPPPPPLPPVPPVPVPPVPPPPSIRASMATNNSATATLPTNLAGDLLVVVQAAGPANISVPAGYTQRTFAIDTMNSIGLNVVTKTSAGGEVSATFAGISALVAVSIQNPVGIDAAGSQLQSGTSWAAPSLNLAAPNDVLLCGWMAAAGISAISIPVSMTLLPIASSGSLKLVVASQTLVAAGPTGTRTATSSSPLPACTASLGVK